MSDQNEQRVSGEASSESATLCGHGHAGVAGDCGAAACATPTRSTGHDAPDSGTAAAEQATLWNDLVRSQQPECVSPSPTTSTALALPETVTRSPMQWTLIDLTSSGCGAPGCDPSTCDEADCEMTGEYDRAGFELPEYADSGRAPAVTFDVEDQPEFAFNDGPSPAPTAFVPAATEVTEASKAEATKARKSAAAQRTKTATKKTAPKAGGKKAAKKKTTVKKAAKKTTAKKPAKKATTARAQKGAAEKASLPMPQNDPQFPRVQAA